MAYYADANATTSRATYVVGYVDEGPEVKAERIAALTGTYRRALIGAGVPAGDIKKLLAQWHRTVLRREYAP